MDDKSIRQTVREELRKLSGMSWGQRLGYIWDYYKPLMVAVAVVICLISIGLTMYHNLQINHLFQAYLINCDSYSTDADELCAEFTEYIGGIGELDEITIDTSTTYNPEDMSQYGMAEVMKLTALGAAGEMDLMIGDDIVYERYANGGGLLELTEVLPEEELKQWEDYLVTGTGEDGTEGYYGIRVTDSAVLGRYPAYAGECYAMIPASAQHLELCVQFLHYLLD